MRERGLGDAFRSVAASATIPIRVVDQGVGRCSPTVEAAMYFCSLEAIQNAVKHAGSDAHVTVTLRRLGEDAEFIVADDGAGFDPDETSAGLGLVSMRDRIDTVGGTLQIISAPGEGTTILGTAPADGARTGGEDTVGEPMAIRVVLGEDRAVPRAAPNPPCAPPRES